jgi:hypothetical protein
MTFEYTVTLTADHLSLLCDLVEERVYELHREAADGDAANGYWQEQMQHYYNLLKSGKNPLISWNSMLGGAYPERVPLEQLQYRFKKL